MTDKDPTVWDELRRAVDDLESTANQAGAAIKQRWTALQPRLHQIKEQMEVKTAAASAWVAEEMEQVGAEVRRLKDEVAARLKR